jgi:3-hydroxybutyryl-CoA dehydrogenase
MRRIIFRRLYNLGFVNHDERALNRPRKGDHMKVDEIRQIAVVGAGQMGHGIAQVFALAGYQVHLNSRNEESLQRGIKNIQDDLQRLIEFEIITQEQAETVLPNIYTSAMLKDAVEDSDVVIEAVYEDLGLKQQLFQELDQLCPARTILASTTSTLMPSKLSQVTRRPDKVLVAHFTGPSYLSPLVEVARSQDTSDEAVSTIYNLLLKAGKRPVLVQKEVPGFIANRLQVALLREALSMVQKGIASAQDVDAVLKDGHARRWAVAGVFEMVEIIAGWDLVLAAAPGVLPYLDNSTDMTAFPIVKEMVERGELGAKTAKGFYEWTPESIEAARDRMAQAYVEIEKWSRT